MREKHLGRLENSAHLPSIAEQLMVTQSSAIPGQMDTSLDITHSAVDTVPQTHSESLSDSVEENIKTSVTSPSDSCHEKDWQMCTDFTVNLNAVLMKAKDTANLMNDDSCCHIFYYAEKKIFIKITVDLFYGNPRWLVSVQLLFSQRLLTRKVMDSLDCLIKNRLEFDKIFKNIFSANSLLTKLSECCQIQTHW